jgi:hypothetical protein
VQQYKKSWKSGKIAEMITGRSDADLGAKSFADNWNIRGE